MRNKILKILPGTILFVCSHVFSPVVVEAETIADRSRLHHIVSEQMKERYEEREKAKEESRQIYNSYRETLKKIQRGDVDSAIQSLNSSTNKLERLSDEILDPRARALNKAAIKETRLLLESYKAAPIDITQLSKSNSDPVSLSQGWGLIYSTGKVVKGAYTGEGPQGGDLLDLALAATRSPDTVSQVLRWGRGAQGYAKTIETGTIPILSIVGGVLTIFDLAQESTISNYFNTVRALPGMQLFKGQTFVLEALVNTEIAIIEKTLGSGSDLGKYLKGQDSEIQKEIDQYQKEDAWREMIDQGKKERGEVLHRWIEEQRSKSNKHSTTEGSQNNGDSPADEKGMSIKY